MAQLHCVYAGFSPVRPTNDGDIVLHIEKVRGLPAAAARALESLGYELTLSIDPRERTAHRFRRQGSVVDVLASGDDVVDVLMADHAAPSVHERLRGRKMVAIDGGTQALQRTVNARLVIDGQETVVSVPSAFRALWRRSCSNQRPTWRTLAILNATYRMPPPCSPASRTLTRPARTSEVRTVNGCVVWQTGCLENHDGMFGVTQRQEFAIACVPQAG